MIVGNGIAGATAAELVRMEAPNAAIMVIADDPFPVYYRPALKDYLAGRVHEDKLWARPGSFYQDHNIHFLADRVVGVQAGKHLVQLQSGRALGYTKLLLANGASANRLRCPGLDLPGVTTLRTVADYQAVVNRLPLVKRVVVTGSGTLALETVETLRHRGYQVTHLIRRQTLWSEVLDATASDLVLQQERRDGVDVHLEEEIAEITGSNGAVTGVVTTRGTHIACEMVLIAIGVEPNIDFLTRSGIGCGRGVRVDNAMRTNAPDIYACGDVLETTDVSSGRVRVIGQWYPAIQQARAAAYSMLDLLDTNSPFRASTFYNATFLYGLNFAAVGLTNAQGYQEMVAEPQPRTYRKVLLKDNIPVGMLTLGNRKQALAFKRAIDFRVNLQPVLAQIFAEDFDLHRWLDSQGIPASQLGVKKASVPIATVPYDTGATRAVFTGKQARVKPEAVLAPLVMPDEAVRLTEVRLTTESPMLVGRQAGVHVLIDQASVSRRHAELSYSGGQFVVRDLGSSNGTFVNNSRLVAEQAQVLNNNDTVRFGSTATYRFFMRAAPVGQKQATPQNMSMAGITLFQGEAMTLVSVSPVAAPMSQPVLQDDGSLLLPETSHAVPAGAVATFKTTPGLLVVSDNANNPGKATPLVYLLNKKKALSIGREKGNDIALNDVVASRRHAEIVPGPDGFYIRDLGSSNGVTVNQTRIDNPYLLKHGDRITIGSSRIYYMYTFNS